MLVWLSWRKLLMARLRGGHGAGQGAGACLPASRRRGFMGTFRNSRHRLHPSVAIGRLAWTAPPAVATYGATASAAQCRPISVRYTTSPCRRCGWAYGQVAVRAGTVRMSRHVTYHLSPRRGRRTRRRGRPCGSAGGGWWSVSRSSAASGPPRLPAEGRILRSWRHRS